MISSESLGRGKSQYDKKKNLCFKHMVIFTKAKNVIDQESPKYRGSRNSTFNPLKKMLTKKNAPFNFNFFFINRKKKKKILKPT